jgi:hypothetical protein
MALVQSVRNHAYKIEKFVSLPATSGTTVGISVPAGTMVLAAGFQNTVAVPDVTTYTVAVTDGTTTFMSATSFDAATINTVKAGSTAGLIATADTIDVLTVISGSPGVITGRVWALVVDVNKAADAASSVDREQLA